MPEYPEDMKKELNALDFLREKMYRVALSYEEYRYLQMLILKYETFFRKTTPIEGNPLVYSTCPLCGKTLFDDKLLFITDTHIGSALEESAYVDYAYNDALKRGIKTAVHLGDLTEANAQDYGKTSDVCLKELESALAHMPDEMKTWLLIGNHDYSAIRTHEKEKFYLNYFSNPKLEVLGMAQAILYFQNLTIRLEHNVKQLRLPETSFQGDMKLLGHYHRGFVDEKNRTMVLPAASVIAEDVELKEFLQKFGITLHDIKNIFMIASREDVNKVLLQTYGLTDDVFGPHVMRNTEVDTKTKVMRFYKS